MPVVAAADGIRIYFEMTGEGQPVLLLPGAFGGLEDWWESGLLYALADFRRVIVLDPRGHGRSEKPLDSAGYGWRTSARDALEVLSAADVRGVDVYGYSMGGHVALSLLHADTNRIRSIAACSVYPTPRDSTAGVALLRRRARILRQHGINRAVLKALFPDLASAPEGWLQRALQMDARVLACEAEGQARMEDQSLPPEGPPTLLLAGEQDALAVALCRRVLPGRPYVQFHGIAGGRHEVGLRPDAIVPALTSFWEPLAD